MAELLALDNFSLLPQGRTLSLRLLPGQSLAILGSAASGKTALLQAIAGSWRPAQGSVQALAEISEAGKGDFGRKSTAQTLARKAVGKRKIAHAAEALTVAKLFDFRERPLHDLTATQIAACELLPCLCAEPTLMLVDGQLDRLDPWTLSSVMHHLRKKLSSGAAMVAVTNRPELLNQFDYIIVLHKRRMVYAGTLSGLYAKGPKSDVRVRTEAQAGVRPLVDALRVQVTEGKDGLRFQADEGQAVAAKLLLDGYGDVDYVVVKPPTLEECLLSLGV